MHEAHLNTIRVIVVPEKHLLHHHIVYKCGTQRCETVRKYLDSKITVGKQGTKSTILVIEIVL